MKEINQQYLIDLFDNKDDNDRKKQFDRNKNKSIIVRPSYSNSNNYRKRDKNIQPCGCKQPEEIDFLWQKEFRNKRRLFPMRKEQKQRLLSYKYKDLYTTSWKTFFLSYPPNKKGGVDTVALRMAKKLKLTADDFSDMFTDVEKRKVLQPNWYNTYAQGICRYIEERIWLTPIIKDTNSATTTAIRATSPIERRIIARHHNGN